MRILHVASFLGNIGDNFNHYGTRKLLEKKFGKIDWVEIEIRENLGKNFSLTNLLQNIVMNLHNFGGGNFSSYGLTKVLIIHLLI